MFDKCNFRDVARLLLHGLTMATLTACSGGGGSDDNSRIPTADSFRTPEFLASTGLEQIRAAQGYAKITGAQGGEGVVIAILDDGVDEDHPDIAENLIGSILPGGAEDRDSTHGTAVAGIAAGASGNGGIHGVAFNAGILGYQTGIDDPDEPGQVIIDTNAAATGLDEVTAQGVDIINMSFGRSFTGTIALSDGSLIAPQSNENDEIIGDGMRIAASRGALMVVSAGNDRDDLDIISAFLEEELGLPPDSAIDIGANFPAYFAADPTLVNATIVAVAVDSDNRLAQFSNSCLGVEARCLAAPGVNFQGAQPGGGIGGIGSGTSYAAPMISGAAAVVQAAFPGTTPQEAGNRLLTTATDLGEPGLDSTFGNGLLNLEEALTPQGSLQVATGARIDGAKSSLADSRLSLGNGLGFAGAGADLLGEVVAFDGDNFPFAVDLSKATKVQSRTTGLSAFIASQDRRTTVMADKASAVTLSVADDPWLDDPYRADFAPSETSLGGDRDAPRLSMRSEVSKGIDVFFGMNGESATDAAVTSALPELGSLFQPAAFLSPFDQLAGEQTGGGAAFEFGEGSKLLLSTFTSSDRDGERFSTMQKVELVHETESDIRLRLGYGFMTEDGGYLGSAARGAFDSSSSGQSHVFDLAIVAPLSERLSFFGAYTQGHTSASGGSGLVSGLSALKSSAFGAGFIMSDVVAEGDGFSFVVGQPLRVNSGSGEITVPTGRTEAGVVLKKSARIDLSPDGREVAFEAVYDFARKDGHAFSAGSFLRLNPDHDDNAKPDIGFGLNYKISF